MLIFFSSMCYPEFHFKKKKSSEDSKGFFLYDLSWQMIQQDIKEHGLAFHLRH